VDDLIAYLVSDTEVFLVPNAANSAAVVRRLTSAAPPGIEVRDRHEDYAVLAVQGPLSRSVLDVLGLLSESGVPGSGSPADLEYMSYADRQFRGRPVRICRTGYTGEHGYEILPRWADATTVWDALAAAVSEVGGRPAGLGARDTLRTEMGYPLHGQDLSMSITAVQARAGWAVGWKKDEFWGRSALLAERTRGPERTLWGVEVQGRGIPRPHTQVLNTQGEPVGEVTSGTFSPTLKRGIGLALIATAAGLNAGDEVDLDVRGRRISALLLRPPFVASHVR
jgi:aminomethyltransferase